MRRVSSSAFFFPRIEQCITENGPRKRQNSAQEPGASPVFPLSMHSAQTKKAPDKDKIAHSNQGYLRLFLHGFFVNIGGSRGKSVIIYYFIIFSF